MRNQERSVFKRLTNTRTALIEVLTAGFILGVCASIIASLVVDKFKNYSDYVLVTSIGLLVLSIIFLANKLGQTRKASLRLYGFIICERKSGNLADVPNYDFASKLHDFMKSAFSENKALGKQWETQPLNKMFDFDIGEGTGTVRINNSAKLVKEACEYYVIDTLSTHLTDFFNKEQFDKQELKELSRSDVPDILLKNRFMELFTSPMHDRESFSEQLKSDRDAKNVVMSTGKGGALFHRFDLVLPKDAVVTRDEEKRIRIETRNFILKFSIDFMGMGYVTPRGFAEHYLGFTDYGDYSCYAISINIDISFKLRSLFLKKTWDYDAWIDGFLNTLDKKVSGDHFFEKINWETVSTIITCGQASAVPNKANSADAKARG